MFAIYFYLVKKGPRYTTISAVDRGVELPLLLGSAVSDDENIYQTLGPKQVINACGKMTILGVSSVAPGDAGHRARGILFRGD